MLAIAHLKKSYSKHDPVLDDISFTLESGECLAVVGPNGCGKTTLLNILAGLQPIDEGVVRLNERDIKEASIGYVFQDYSSSLFPWLTAGENIAFPLKLQGIKKNGARKIVQEICHTFQCTIRLDAYPHQLSGGQKQLISILRSLVVHPDLFLLDEPFASLDYTARIHLLETFSQLWQQTRAPTFFVSHDVEEAVFLSTTILILSHKPARILAKIKNPLPFPRTRQLMTDPRFVELRNTVLSLINKSI